MRVVPQPLTLQRPTGAQVVGSSVATQVPQTPARPASEPPIPSGSSLAQRGTPAQGSARLFDVRLQSLKTIKPNDGLAFVETALADLKSRVARGEKARVVFDLDNTLFDTRQRTFEIARAFDAANGTSHFKGLTLDKVGRDGAHTAERLGLPADVAKAFQETWNVEFWRGDNLAHDTPMASMIDLAKQAKAAGAEVVYLTGRDTTLQPASLAQLIRHGLPDADAEHLFCKPVGTRTAEFKATQMNLWMNHGSHIGFFVTEGRRDIAHVQSAAPRVPCLMLPCSLEGHADVVRTDTPCLPGLF